MTNDAQPHLALDVLCDEEAFAAFDTPRLHALLNAAVVDEDLPAAALTIRFVNAHNSQEMHAAHFNDDSSTDVMTFPDGTTDPESDRLLLGDLAVCPKIAQDRVAAGHGQTEVAEEVELYCLHGLLHLLGFDDQDPSDRADMWQRQAEIVAPFFTLHSHGDEHRAHEGPQA